MGTELSQGVFICGFICGLYYNVIRLKKLIETELEISKTLERIQFESEEYDYFQSNIIFRKFDESK